MAYLFFSFILPAKTNPKLFFSNWVSPFCPSLSGLKLNSSSRGETYEVDEGIFGGYDGIDEESDEDESESSVDLLIRFLQSMFRKVSKRAKKASRSVLPAVISPQLVSFPLLLFTTLEWDPSHFN